jgi:hypothetical protein
MRAVKGAAKAQQSPASAADPAPTKKRVNSRAKGAGFERDIARDLRTWLGDGWDVSRTPTDRQRAQDRTGHAGEFTIIPPEHAGATFPWAIECKDHATFDLRQLWRAPVDGPLPKWWAQAVRQAESVGRIPLLVVKVARGETLVFRVGAPATAPEMTVLVGNVALTVCRWADIEGEVRAIGGAL